MTSRCRGVSTGQDRARRVHLVLDGRRRLGTDARERHSTQRCGACNLLARSMDRAESTQDRKTTVLPCGGQIGQGVLCRHDPEGRNRLAAPIAWRLNLFVADLAYPREVARVILGPRCSPDWLALERAAGRIIVADRGDGGELALDEGFRDPDADRPGIDFARAEWPHGTTGAATPHGTVFGG